MKDSTCILKAGLKPLLVVESTLGELKKYMNIAKFITTVIGTAIYISAFWSVIFLNHIEPVIVLSITIFVGGSVGIVAGILRFLVEHWDE